MRRSALLVLPSLALGCVSSTETPNDLAGAADQASNRDLAGVVQDFSSVMDLAMGGGNDLASSSYPAGPYGNQVGDVIPPLQWEGYNDDAADALATTKTFGPYTMNDLRLSGKTFGIVHVAEFF
jgi:hypothetical protein